MTHFAVIQHVGAINFALRSLPVRDQRGEPALAHGARIFFPQPQPFGQCSAIVIDPDDEVGGGAVGAALPQPFIMPAHHPAVGHVPRRRAAAHDRQRVGATPALTWDRDVPKSSIVTVTASPTLLYEAAHALRDWCRFSQTGTAYIEPGSPWENPFIESFNSRVRDELLAWRASPA